jgi:hypothetical protein
MAVRAADHFVRAAIEDHPQLAACPTARATAGLIRDGGNSATWTGAGGIS